MKIEYLWTVEVDLIKFLEAISSNSRWRMRLNDF
jgi:hypothetical protein